MRQGGKAARQSAASVQAHTAAPATEPLALARWRSPGIPAHSCRVPFPPAPLVLVAVAAGGAKFPAEFELHDGPALTAPSPPGNQRRRRAILAGVGHNRRGLEHLSVVDNRRADGGRAWRSERRAWRRSFAPPQQRPGALRHLPPGIGAYRAPTLRVAQTAPCCATLRHLCATLRHLGGAGGATRKWRKCVVSVSEGE